MSLLNLLSKRLIDELDLRPIQDGEVRIFRLINARKLDPNSTKKTSTPQHVGIASQDKITDPYASHGPADIIISNIVSYNPITRPGEKTVYDPVIANVNFPSTGEIPCTSQDNELYYYLKLNNKNSSNPHRKKSKRALYYEVDEAANVLKQTNQFDYRTMAANLLLDADDDKMVEYARKINRAGKDNPIDLNLSEEKIKARLGDLIDNDAMRFIAGVKEDKSYARLVVDDARVRKKITFDETAFTWNWRKIGSEKARKPIIKLDSAKNSVKGLVDYLLTDAGKEARAELITLYEQHYSKA